MKILIEDEEIRPNPIPSSPFSLPMPVVDEDGEISIRGIVERQKELGNGGKQLTQLQKEVIALDATTSSMSQQDVAKVHGVSQEAVSYLSRGFNTTNIDERKVNEGVREVVQSSREKIADLATKKLLKTIEFFVPETLDQKELPGAAVKLAAVVEKVSQGFQGEGSNRPQFIVFSPRMRREESYDVIDVSAVE